MVFYTFLSLSDNMARSSTLLPLHLGLQVILVSSQRKEGKKKVLFSWKSCLSWLSTKKKGPAGSNPGERIYNHSVKTTTSFTGKELRVPLLKRLWTGIEICVCHICVAVCVHMNCANVSVVVGVQSYSETVLSCGAGSSRQLLRMMGSGWASVLKTQSSRERRSSSENSRYRYLSTGITSFTYKQHGSLRTTPAHTSLCWIWRVCYMLWSWMMPLVSVMWCAICDMYVVTCVVCILLFSFILFL